MTSPAFNLGAPVLVRSPNWLGDAVMALPAVRNLKTALGDGALVVAAPEKLAALWQACPFVDRVAPLETPKNLWSSALRLREEKCAGAVLLPNSLRSAAEVFCAGIPRRIGYARGARGLLLTQTVPVPPRNPVRLHQRFYYLDLVSWLGAPADETLPALRVPAAQEASPKSGGQPVLAVCPGAEYGPAKRWSVENFVAAARLLAAKCGLRVVLFGAPNDAPVASAFLAQFPEAENRVGQTSLGEFMAELAGAKLVLCNDSGAMHLASALGVPTVAIFGSTEPQLTGPLGPRTAVVRHHVPCSPCFRRECPIDFACMLSLTPERVVEEAEKLLRAGKDIAQVPA